MARFVIPSGILIKSVYINAQPITISPAKSNETATLGQIWYESWFYAHAHLIEPALAEARTLERFNCRILEHLDHTLVARRDETPIGLSIIKGDELHQFFMSAEGRGTGAAVLLMEATEEKMVQNGVTEAYLMCLKGNDRAAAFYSKMGWLRGALMQDQFGAGGKVFEVLAWRFAKLL